VIVDVIVDVAVNATVGVAVHVNVNATVGVIAKVRFSCLSRSQPR
jgi:hypothetical protein